MDVFVDQVTQIWGEPPHQVVALEGFSHRFPSHRFSCLLGPSGCGKSTLIQIVGGLEPATAGTSASSIPARPRSSARSAPTSVMVWQNLNLFPWRSVIDNIAFGLEMRGVARAERYRRRRRIDHLGRPARVSSITCRASCPAACASAWRLPAR